MNKIHNFELLIFNTSVACLCNVELPQNSAICLIVPVEYKSVLIRSSVHNGCSYFNAMRDPRKLAQSSNPLNTAANCSIKRASVDNV